MQKFIGFFQDGSGNLSATRLAFLLWTVGVLTVWIWVSIHTGTLAPIDSSVQTILGVLMTGKVVQSFSPNDAAPAGTGGALVVTNATVPVTVAPASGAVAQ